MRPKAVDNYLAVTFLIKATQEFSIRSVSFVTQKQCYFFAVSFGNWRRRRGDEQAKASHYVDEIRSVGARRDAEHFTSVRKIEKFVAYVICNTDRSTPTKPYPTYEPASLSGEIESHL